LILELLRGRAAELSAPQGDEGRAAIAALAGEPLRLHAALARLDVDALRLMASFDTGEAVDLAELLAALDNPDASEVVRLSVALMPSVLEATHAKESQALRFDGYAGLHRRGELDALLFSELALPAPLFAARYAERELFYYAHERAPEQRQRHHH